MSADEQFMELALEEAKQGKTEGEWPFGSVIVSGDKVISRNHSREVARKTVLSHAELHAIDDACKALGRFDLSDCVIYCTNEPCIMCASAIFQAKIPRVVIAASRTDLPHILRQRKFRIDHLAEDSGYNPEIVRDVMKEEVIELFKDLKRI